MAMDLLYPLKELIRYVLGAALFLALFLVPSFLIVVVVVITPFLMLLFNPKRLQIVYSYIADWYWPVMDWLVEDYGGSRLYFSGDDVPPRESAMILSNHLVGIDWLMMPIPFAMVPTLCFCTLY
jgi:1-acyl-sn-glycerol-3-phosphate acyltransferase